MIHWLIIIIGVIFLSASISNSVYMITIKKYLTINFIFELLLRVLLFILSIIIILLGLYLESKL